VNGRKGNTAINRKGEEIVKKVTKTQQPKTSEIAYLISRNTGDIQIECHCDIININQQLFNLASKLKYYATHQENREPHECDCCGTKAFCETNIPVFN